MSENGTGSDSSISDDDIIKILVSTDNHLGYGERDPICKEDSFETFEEILQLAQENKVDMILLGGDLFHDNKPSRKSVHRALSLLRKYCLGDKECHLELLSDPAVNFGHCDFSHLNYQDPNYNIAYPVFSVHGNHDDPTGVDSLSAIDIISTAGLLNHFGKAASCDKIEMSPVLLKKGVTKFALYGLGAMRDERLHNTFAMKNVNMLRPREDPDSWFNLFVIHQNRSKHGPKNYIPEGFLDEFLDLVIWGHEHECLIEPTWTESNKKFFVSQPGSSVATSLSEGESKQKHVGLLQIHKKTFKMEKLPLKTVRQFMMESIVLSETSLQPHEEDKLYSYLTERVEQLISQAEQTHTGHPKQPRLPLIRLKVEYSGNYEIVNPHRFGQQFVDKVANCKDILLFYRKKVYSEKKDKVNVKEPELRLSQASTVRMEDLINQYLNSMDDSLQLDVLSERKLSKALNEFVLKEEKDAISELVKYQLEKTQQEINNRNMKETDIDAIISEVKEVENNMDENEEDKEIETVMSNVRNQSKTMNGDDEVMHLDDDEEVVREEKAARGRGGKGSRGGRGAAKAAKTTKTSTRGGRGGRGGARGKAKLDVTQTTLTNSFMSTARSGRDDEDTYKSGVDSSRMKMSRHINIDSSDDDDSDPFKIQSTKRSRR